MRKTRRTAIGCGLAAALAGGTVLLAGAAGARGGNPPGTSAVALAAVGPAAASPGTAMKGAASQAAAPAYPTFVTLPGDQAAHPGFENEWWYVVGHVTADGHVFGYEVQIIARSDVDGTTEPLTPAEAIVAITDVTTGQYVSQVFQYDPGQGTFSSAALDESTPNATLSGPLNAMRLQASMPAGSVDLTLDARGPAIYNGGNGLIPFLAGSSYYYSLPTVSTTGTLVEGGRAYQVNGQSWVDHQWGDWNWLVTQKWTWMGIQLSDGVSVDLWDIFSSGTEDHYATVLEPDGTEHIVAVEPLASRTSGFVTSPTTGQRYGSQWRVVIPALHASLTVRAIPELQEIQALGGIYEGDAAVTGEYGGRPVTGLAYAEQLGDWHS
ncbi:MAG TPA: lipocalin-like domain-containing protein [Trebonia sp.]|nr:lipocalin-like domain-containing protein [Trebonia sp.]